MRRREFVLSAVPFVLPFLSGFRFRPNQIPAEYDRLRIIEASELVGKTTTTLIVLAKVLADGRDDPDEDRHFVDVLSEDPFFLGFVMYKVRPDSNRVTSRRLFIPFQQGEAPVLTHSNEYPGGDSFVFRQGSAAIELRDIWAFQEVSLFIEQQVESKLNLSKKSKGKKPVKTGWRFNTIIVPPPSV